MLLLEICHIFFAYWTYYVNCFWMLFICRRKASTTSWETFSSMGRSKSSMDVSNITESNITDTYVTDSMIIDTYCVYTKQNLITSQSLLTTGLMIIIPMILLQKDLLIIIIAIIIIIILRPLPDNQRWFFSLQNRCFTDGWGWYRGGGGRTKSLLSGTVRLWTRTPRAGGD